jgi:hypothetical protein
VFFGFFVRFCFDVRMYVKGKANKLKNECFKTAQYP